MEYHVGGWVKATLDLVTDVYIQRVRNLVQLKKTTYLFQVCPVVKINRKEEKLPLATLKRGCFPCTDRIKVY